MASLSRITNEMEEILSESEFDDLLIEFQDSQPGIEFANFDGQNIYYNVTSLENDSLKDELSQISDLSVESRGDVFITLEWENGRTVEEYISKFELILDVLGLELSDVSSIQRKDLT